MDDFLLNIDAYSISISLPDEREVEKNEINSIGCSVDDFQLCQSLLVNQSDNVQNVLSYISGYIIWRCSRDHKCADCKHQLSQETPILSQSSVLTSFKSFETTSFGGLTVPTDQFLNFVTNMNTQFDYIFPKIIHMSKIKERVVRFILRQVKEAGL